MNISTGNKLKQLRKSKSMSQEQVADYLHLSQSAYARMESGESHSWASHIDKICEVFDITPEELVRSEKVIIGNIGTNNGVGYAEVVNQLSEKLIELYEERIKELKQVIVDLNSK
jgi:transcriptional regulator with XRE-family HTH domain